MCRRFSTLLALLLLLKNSGKAAKQPLVELRVKRMHPLASFRPKSMLRLHRTLKKSRTQQKQGDSTQRQVGLARP